MRRLRSFRPQPRNLDQVFVAANWTDLRPAILGGRPSIGVNVNVCREPLRMLGLDMVLVVLVHMEMDDRPQLKGHQQDRTKNACKLLPHSSL